MLYSTKFLFLLFVIYVKFDRSSAIKCYAYNQTCGSACSEIKDCGAEQHCFSLWFNSTNSTHEITRTELQGCFHVSSKNECSDQSKCIASSNSKHDLWYCCCGEDLCNGNYSWAPVPAGRPTTSLFNQQDDITQNPIRGTNNTIIIIVIIAILLSVAAFGSCYFYLNKQKISYFKKRFKLVPLLDPQRSAAATVQTPVVPLRRIELMEVLMMRKFGAVWKAIDLEDMRKVAVKIMSTVEEKCWSAEVETYRLPKMDEHENILKFIAAEKRDTNYGVVDTSDGATDTNDDVVSTANDDLPVTKLWLITEYHEKGSLMDYLKKNKVTWEQLFKIAHSMARGLAHLHEEIPFDDTNQYKLSVAHRDIKSSNVMLKDDLTACIADFGLALIFRPSISCGDTHPQVGTRRYMAPEVLEGAINFSKDSFLRIDMYAFGLVLWELMSRCSSLPDSVDSYKMPFEEEIGVQPSLDTMEEKVAVEKLRPTIKESWRKIPGFDLLCETVEECWDHDAEARLSASCAFERIEKAQQACSLFMKQDRH